jgi:hypothetical protein
MSTDNKKPTSSKEQNSKKGPIKVVSGVEMGKFIGKMGSTAAKEIGNLGPKMATTAKKQLGKLKREFEALAKQAENNQAAKQLLPLAKNTVKLPAEPKSDVNRQPTTPSSLKLR